MDVIQKMRLRDNLKKQFDFDEVLWQQYKMAQNECNNLIRQAKRHYFTLNIDAARNDPKKTWKLISELSFRKIRNGCNKALKVTTWLRTVTCPPLLHWLPDNDKFPDNSKIQCVYCSGHHYSASCEKIVPFEARK